MSEAGTIAATSTPATVASLARDLAALGLPPDGTVQKSGPIRRDGRRVSPTYDDMEFDTEDFAALGAVSAANAAAPSARRGADGGGRRAVAR
jgi:hypothetical protein